MKDLLEQLRLRAAGALDLEEEARLDAELAERPDLSAEVEAFAALEARLLDGIPPSPPQSAGRSRLLSALTGPARFLPFLDETAELFGLSPDAMMDVLALTDDTASWTPTGVPGVSFRHFDAGPELAHADTGLVRFAPNATFPRHVHHGRELTYVLQGELHFDDGTTLKPGDRLLLDRTEHAVSAGPEEVLYLTFHEGLTVKG